MLWAARPVLECLPLAVHKLTSTLRAVVKAAPPQEAQGTTILGLAAPDSPLPVDQVVSPAQHPAIPRGKGVTQVRLQEASPELHLVASKEQPLVPEVTPAPNREDTLGQPPDSLVDLPDIPLLLDPVVQAPVPLQDSKATLQDLPKAASPVALQDQEVIQASKEGSQDRPLDIQVVRDREASHQVHLVQVATLELREEDTLQDLKADSQALQQLQVDTRVDHKQDTRDQLQVVTHQLPRGLLVTLGLDKDILQALQGGSSQDRLHVQVALDNKDFQEPPPHLKDTRDLKVDTQARQLDQVTQVPLEVQEDHLPTNTLVVEVANLVLVVNRAVDFQEVVPRVVQVGSHLVDTLERKEEQLELVGFLEVQGHKVGSQAAKVGKEDSFLQEDKVDSSLLEVLVDREDFLVVRVDSIPLGGLEELEVFRAVKADKVDSFPPVELVELEVSPVKVDVLELVEVVEMKTTDHMMKETTRQSPVNQALTTQYTQKFLKRHSVATSSNFRDTTQMLRQGARYSTSVPTTKHTTSCVQMERFSTRSTSYVCGGTSSIVTLPLASSLSIRSFTIIRL